MAPPKRGAARGAAAAKAVEEHCPKGVESDIREYLASTASGLLEEADDGADQDGLIEDLEGAIRPFLEDAGVSAGDTATFCRRIVAAAFGQAAPAAGQNGKAAAPEPAGKAKAGSKASAKAKGTAGGAATAGAAGGAAGPSGDRLCYVENLMLMYGGSPEPLLRNTTLELVRGHRYGVVGANGAGKTTLMSRIAAKEIMGVPKDLTCVHLRHETILEGVDPSTAAREYARLKGGSGGGETASAEQAAVDKSLKDVGFEDEMLGKAVSALSGGWRMRLALACAMAQRADVLLLDEPTNHLDTVAVAWLVGFINTTCIGGQMGGTAMIVSHDPDFLNLVCTDIVHFTSDGKLAYHPGNFDAFKQQALGGDEGEARRLLEIMREANIAGGTGMATSRAQAAAHAELADDSRMSFPIPEKIVGVTASKPVLTLNNVSFQYTEEHGPVLRNVTVRLTMTSRVAVIGRNGAGKSTMMSLIAGDLQPCPINGEQEGEVHKHRNLRLAYIAQQHMHHLGEYVECTPCRYIQERFRHGWDEEAQQRLTLPQTEEEANLRVELAKKYGKRGKEVESLLSRTKKGKEILYEVKWKELDDPKQNTYEPMSRLRLLGVEKMAAALDERLACQASGTDRRPLTNREIVKHLEPFGITEEMTLHREIKKLSMGQKSKLMLGCSFWTKPHIVCLDEPTNYLDVETVEALARALRNFRGGCVVITHNEKFIDDVCEEVWEVGEGRVVVRPKDGGPAKTLKVVGGSKAAATAKAQEAADKEIGTKKGVEAQAARSQEDTLAMFLEARRKMGAAKTDVKVSNFDMDAPDGTPLLRDTNLQLTRGRRYGLAGRNGAGKSTLLRAIARYELGKSFPRNIKVLLVEQEAAGDDRGPLQTLLDGDVELALLRREEKTLQEAETGRDEVRLKAVHERLEEIGASDAEARANRILRGLQFTPDLLEKPTKALSGGWRMRVSLAMALFAQPEILLLDEPTNHLDFPAVLWLEDYLNEYKETAVIVSHDRHFLDNVATDIIQLQAQRLTYYRGNFSAYADQAREQRVAQQRAFDAQQLQIKHIEEFINRFDMQLPKEERAKKHPAVVSQIESKKRQLEKMERVEDPAVTYGDAENLSFRFPPVGALRRDELVRLDNVTFGYPGNPPLCEGATVRVDLKSRVGVLGRNGAGKSTLLKVMTGELAPQKGDVSTNRNMRVAFFAQHHVDTLDLTLTCVEVVQGRFPSLSDQDVRNMLGRVGIQGDMALRRVKTLSGGQKSRVALAIVTQCEPHMIILDEPTNHLDMETIDSLIEAIEHYDGAVVFVSHDQYFLSKVANELWAVAAGAVRIFRDLDEAKQFTYKACEVRS